MTDRERCPHCGGPMKKGNTFHPITEDDVSSELEGLPDDLRAGVIEWWNVSRRSKHGTRAVWTRRAFGLSVDRVQAMWSADRSGGTANAARLVSAGVENGWMGLKPEYLAKPELLAAPVEIRPDRVQLAIQQWNNR